MTELEIDINQIAIFTDQFRLNKDFNEYYRQMKFDIEVIKHRCKNDRFINEQYHLCYYARRIKSLREDSFPLFLN